MISNHFEFFIRYIIWGGHQIYIATILLGLFFLEFFFVVVVKFFVVMTCSKQKINLLLKLYSLLNIHHGYLFEIFTSSKTWFITLQEAKDLMLSLMKQSFTLSSVPFSFFSFPFNLLIRAKKAEGNCLLSMPGNDDG